jgi:hypothetical protein
MYIDSWTVGTAASCGAERRELILGKVDDSN